MSREITMARQLPDRLRDAQVKLITQDPSFEPVREYLADLKRFVDKGIGLCLCGPNGVGKTFAMGAIYKQAARQCDLSWNELLWCEARDIARRYEYGYVDSKFNDDVDDRLEGAKVLFIDELGREADVKNGDGRLLSLHRIRHNRRLVTNFTTNLSIDELRRGYGESFMSRLAEAYYLVEVAGEDRRGIDQPTIADSAPARALPEPDDEFKDKTRNQLVEVAKARNVNHDGLRTTDLKKVLREHKTAEGPQRKTPSGLRTAPQKIRPRADNH